MTAEGPTAGGTPGDTPEHEGGTPDRGGWVVLQLFRGARAAREHALVLEALQIPFDLARGPGGWRLAVPVSHAARARQQLETYARENIGWPPVDESPGPWSRGALSAVIYAALISLAYHLQQRVPVPDWAAPGGLAEAGTLRGQLVRDGEWWRCVTALTLHADPPHLMGNLVFGVLFGVLACQLVGSGLAWCAILAAGFAGNLANVWLQAPTHAAYGASTAVFGAVGLMAAWRWRRRGALRHGALSRWAALFAGVALLGLLGVGDGERVDVVAHLTGFAAGLAAGVGAAAWRARRELPGPWSQAGLGVLALAAVGACWSRALGAGWWPLS